MQKKHRVYYMIPFFGKGLFSLGICTSLGGFHFFESRSTRHPKQEIEGSNEAGVYVPKGNLRKSTGIEVFS